MRSALICVKMLVDERFPGYIYLTMPNRKKKGLKVDYNWRLLKCSLCSCFGHAKEECRKTFPKDNASKI